MPKRLTSRLLSPLFALLAACGNYDVTVNEALVYRPEGLFRDFELADTALRNCVTQSIADGGIRRAEQLERLNCSRAGIRTLDGLATFTGLTHLKLSGNRIRNLVELAALTRLQELYLDDNVVVDPVPLYPLPSLRILDLSNNASLQCPGPKRLALLQSRLRQLTLPGQCPVGPSLPGGPSG